MGSWFSSIGYGAELLTPSSSGFDSKIQDMLQHIRLAVDWDVT